MVAVKKGKATMQTTKVEETGTKSNGHEVKRLTKVAEAVFLREIYPDYTWNVRSEVLVRANQVSDEGEGDEGATFDGLVASIKESGQDTPVDVRLAPKGSKHKYLLVTGFRRFAAITELAKQGGSIKGNPTWTPTEPTILAFNHGEMGDADARTLNIRENSARNNLKTSDLVFGLGDLLRNSKDSQTKLGEFIGHSQSYTARLQKVASLQGDVLSHWRSASAQVPMAEMVVIAGMKTGPAAQKEAYEKAAKKREEKADDKPQGDEAAAEWEGTKKKVARLAAILGALDADGFDLAHPDFANFLSKHFIGDNDYKKLTGAQKKELTDVAARSFVASGNKTDAEKAAKADGGTVTAEA